MGRQDQGQIANPTFEDEARDENAAIDADAAMRDADLASTMAGDKEAEGARARLWRMAKTTTLSDVVYGSASNASMGAGTANADVLLDNSLRRKWFGLLHPDTPLRSYYDTLHMLILLYFLFIIPWRLAFDVQSEGSLLVLDGIIDFILLFDIYGNFHYFYYDKKQILVTDPHMIHHRYMSHWFLIDVIGTVPFDQVLRLISFFYENEHLKELSTTCRITRFARLAHLIRLSKVLNPQKLQAIVQHMLRPLGIRQMTVRFYFRIGFLVFVLLVAVHLFGCYWMAVGRISSATDEPSGWLHKYYNQNYTHGVTEPRMEELYKMATYFAMVTLSSVGYGDITPTTPDEMVVGITVILTGAFLYAFIVGEFGTLIANLSTDANAFDNKMRSLQEQLDHIRAPEELIDTTLDFFNAQKESPTFAWDELTNEVPDNLRCDLELVRFGQLVRSIPFMRDAADHLVLRVAHRMEHYTCAAGYYLCRKGEPSNDLLLITHGVVRTVEERREDDDSTEDEYIEEYREGAMFGLREFLGILDRRGVTVKARVCVECSKLNKDVLRPLYTRFPSLKTRLAQYTALRLAARGASENLTSPEYAEALKAASVSTASVDNTEDEKPLTEKMYRNNVDSTLSSIAASLDSLTTIVMDIQQRQQAMEAQLSTSRMSA